MQNKDMRNKDMNIKETDMYENANKIKEHILKELESSLQYSDEEILRLIGKEIINFGKITYLPIKTKIKLKSIIFNSLRRYDILQELLNDDHITEIMVNGYENIFIEKNGIIVKCDLKFESEDRLYNIIQSMVSSVNRSVNESSPIVDARLSDGSRINAVLCPTAINGPILTIRKFPESPLTMNDLEEKGSITKEASNYLKQKVIEKKNIFISGGTGSGKTTFLNILSSFIPSDERIITIEDSAELKLQNAENLVSLECRNANADGKGEITVRSLIKTSLRMRPDRIIVGEVRGSEALDMLIAMNTGHSGSISTGHANSPKDLFSRLETMVLCAESMPVESVRNQIASALDLIIHLGKDADGKRKVLEITEVNDYKNSEFQLNTIYGGKDAKHTIKKL